MLNWKFLQKKKKTQMFFLQRKNMQTLNKKAETTCPLSSRACQVPNRSRLTIDPQILSRSVQACRENQKMKGFA